MVGSARATRRPRSATGATSSSAATTRRSTAKSSSRRCPCSARSGSGSRARCAPRSGCGCAPRSVRSTSWRPTSRAAATTDRATPTTCPPPCEADDTLNTCQGRQAADLLDDAALPESVGVLIGDLNADARRADDRRADVARLRRHVPRGRERRVRLRDGRRLHRWPAGRRPVGPHQPGQPAVASGSTTSSSRRSATARSPTPTGLFAAEPASPAARRSRLRRRITPACRRRSRASRRDADLRRGAAGSRRRSTTTTTAATAVDAATKAAITEAFETVFNGGGDIETRLDCARRTRTRCASRSSPATRIRRSRRSSTRSACGSTRCSRSTTTTSTSSIRSCSTRPRCSTTSRARRCGRAVGGWSRGARYCQVATLGQSTVPERLPLTVATAEWRSDLRKLDSCGSSDPGVGSPVERGGRARGGPTVGIQTVNETWQLRAACRGPESTLFFPPTASERKEEREAAGAEGEVDLLDLRGAAVLPRLRPRDPRAARHLGRSQRARTPRAARGARRLSSERRRPTSQRPGRSRSGPPVDFGRGSPSVVPVLPVLSGAADGDTAGSRHRDAGARRPRPAGVHAAPEPERRLGRRRVRVPRWRGGSRRPRPAESWPAAPIATTPTPARTSGLADGGLGFWVAGVRETFEEAGVLLARSADDRSAGGPGRAPARDPARRAQRRHR